jgi:hypothetical protein
MDAREVVVLSWCRSSEKPNEISLGIINHTQDYMGNVAVGAVFAIDAVLEDYPRTLNLIGRIALAEPDYSKEYLDTDLHLSKTENAAGFGIIRYNNYSKLLSRLDRLERMSQLTED